MDDYNKSYVVPKNGVVTIGVLAGTSALFDYGIIHNGVEERLYTYSASTGTVPMRLNFQVNKGETLRVLYFGNVTSLYSSYFIPYKA